MPITRSDEAKEGGFTQVREALQSLEMDVVAADYGDWGDSQKYGKGPQEFLSLDGENVVVLESTEELSMDISQEYNLRINCSDYKGSFWVEHFIPSCEAHKLILPDSRIGDPGNLIGKRLAFKKVAMEYQTKDGGGVKNDYVVVGVKEIKKGTSKVDAPAPTEASTEEELAGVVIDLADGKTAAQFKSAASLNTSLRGSPLLPMIQSGELVQGLIDDGLLVVEEVNGRTVYKKV